MDKPREIALKTLVSIEQEKSYSNIILNKMIKENSKILSEKDKAFISELVYGIISMKLTLDEIIKKYSNIKIKKISIWILNVLRMGTYQIIFLDKVPKSAAVNESVNLAKRYGHKASSNFVNAILRKINKSDYDELFLIKNDIERISKTRSMPEWIIKELLKDRNIEEVDKICKNLNNRPKVQIRVNTLKTTKEELETILQKEDIKCSRIEEMPNFLEANIKNIENFEYFKKGYFTVQDISAGLTAEILSPKENEIILDACAAPGGKTTYMAELMKNKGEVIAWDIHKHRVDLIKENANRLGIDIIKAETQDSTKFNPKYENYFDKILLDVPCLGIGVIKRKPDIKWQKSEKDIQEIVDLQFKILENISRYLKPGGFLVYSTCSILKEENEEQIEKFLEKHSEYERVSIDEISTLGNIEDIKKKFTKNGYFKIEPDESKDGFFIEKLRKK